MSSIPAWTCSECSVDNAFSEDKCQECQSPRAGDSDTAVCPFCAGRLPRRSVEKCPHCLYKLSTTGPLNDWHCPECTFTNHATLLNCEMCEQKRPGGKLVRVTSVDEKSMANKMKEGLSNLVRSKSLSQKQEPSFGIDVARLDQTWQCSKCAYDCNPTWNQVCDTCSNPKTGTAQKVPASPIGLWFCSRTDCRNMNLEVSLLCSKCGRPRDNMSRWTCKQCQHDLNEMTSLKCRGCGEMKFDVKNKKKNVPVVNHPVVNHPFVNHPVVNHPVVNFPNMKKEEKPICTIGTEKKREFWSCPRCTFHNEQRATTCAMCESGKQSSSSKSMKEVRIIEEEGSEQERLEIICQCRLRGGLFTDDEFPPTRASLYGAAAHESGLPSYGWVRPRETTASSKADLDESWTVLNNPKASDIKQGVLGDCWLLSALAVITEKPELLGKILVTKEISEYGIYQVHLCKDGAWVVVTIDDHLPTTSHGHLVYSSASRRQLWVPLIEKAMAKMYGSYDALTAGKSIEGMSALTGAACESIELQASKGGDSTVDKDDIWLRILSMREAGFLLGASCGAGNMVVDEDKYKAVGLRPRHAYSVLDVQLVQDKYRLLCLRNPWGNFSWKGEWSEGDAVWSQLRYVDLEKLTLPRDSDGTFWISIEDVLRYFDSIDACKLRSHWEEIRLRHQLPSGGDHPHQVIKIRVESSVSEVEILLFQADERGDFRASLMDLCIMVFRGTVDKLGPLVEASLRKPRKFINCYKVLEPGDYVVVTTAFNHWKQDGGAADCVVVLHSSKKIHADIVPAEPRIVADALCKLAKARGKQHPGSTDMKAYYLSEGWSGMILVVENLSPVNFLRVESQFEGSLNVVSTREVLATVDVLPPRHIQVIQVMTQLEQSDSYHVTNKLRHNPMTFRDRSLLYSSQEPPLQFWTRPLHMPRQLD